MPKDDAILQSLDAAIEAAYDANQKAHNALQKAIRAAFVGGILENDYRYKYANQVANASIRLHNIGARYFLTRGRNKAAEKRRAAKGKGR